MKEHYSYDEIYGTLVYQNETDDIRKYFVIDCECYKFIWWMFRHGWNKIRDHPSERNGIYGKEITLKRDNSNNPTK